MSVEYVAWAYFYISASPVTFWTISQTTCRQFPDITSVIHNDVATTLLPALRIVLNLFETYSTYDSVL